MLVWVCVVCVSACLHVYCLYMHGFLVLCECVFVLCVCVCLHVCSLYAIMYVQCVSLFIPEPGMDTCGTDA